MNKGDLVFYRFGGKSFYIVTKKKKFDYHFEKRMKNRIEVIYPGDGRKHWFLEEDLEVLSEKV